MMRLALLAVLAGGCLIGGETRVVTALDLRAGVVGADLSRMDPRTRSALAAGLIWPGEREAELYMALGEPHLWWNTKIGENACRVFVHHRSDPAVVDLAVTTCGGTVIGTNAIQPALPCWRLAEVGPRIAAALSYFEARPLDVQWQIVIGLLHRGQAEQDIMIAFGQPHSRGFDEREDGKRAEKLAFLDRSGDAYGLSVTLIDNKVVGWQMPAQRTLTPEAQQRRLQAMEQRLNDKIARLESLQNQQHQESVAMFGEVMANQATMLSKLTQPPSPVAVGATAAPAPPSAGTTRSTSTLTGSNTLTINGKTYTDSPGGELGKPCSTQQNTCTSPKYACHLVTSTNGMCVPR